MQGFHENDNYHDNDNDFNRISRIVPDQVGFCVRTAKPSGRMIPDQSDRRRAEAPWRALADWTERHTHQGLQAVAGSKTIQAFILF
jgi:hypothetical protein